MHQEMTFSKGCLLVFLFIFVQSLLGRWMIWSRIIPEGDVACLILFSLSIGREKGALLGIVVGILRGLFSHHLIGLGIFLLAGLGFLSGHVGQRRRVRRRLEKFLFIFLALFVLDTLFGLLGGVGGSPGYVAYYRERVFPSAFLGALIGHLIGSFFQ